MSGCSSLRGGEGTEDGNAGYMCIQRVGCSSISDTRRTTHLHRARRPLFGERSSLLLDLLEHGGQPGLQGLDAALHLLLGRRVERRQAVGVAEDVHRRDCRQREDREGGEGGGGGVLSVDEEAAGVLVLRVVLGRSGWSVVGWQLLVVDYNVSRELSLAKVDAAVCGGCLHAPAPPIGSSMTMLSSATPALTMGASPASERGGRESDRGQGQSG